jgi:cytochrome c biogenesis protein
MATERRAESTGDGAPRPKITAAPGIVERLASVGLTLWLLGILAAAMAAATIIPQKAPAVVYERAFGTLIGPLIAQTTLRDIFGAWWFIGAFALLAVNLAACSLQQSARLLRQNRRDPSEITPEQVMAKQQRARWPAACGLEEAISSLREALRKRGYAVKATSAQGQIAADRGRLRAWAPVLVHVGMILVLLGAAYGRLPRNTYRTIANLAAGESFMADIGEDAFSVRLLEAGSERDPMGQPTRFWARAEILQGETVVKSAVLEPNHPLRYRGVSVVLQALPQPGYAVAVSPRDSQAQEYVPVVFAQDGTVDMMSTIQRLENPPWVVFVHDFQYAHDGAQHGTAARVFIDQSGELSHNWEPVGWVDQEGLEYSGVRFRLLSQTQGAQLSLDRDLGVPIVWLGFGVIALGAVLLIGMTRRSLIAVVRTKGSRSQVLIGGSGAGVICDLERIAAHMGAKLDHLAEGDIPSGERDGNEGK